MDVFFETSSGKKFEIEIWFFSTIREIKEMIQKYHGYPLSDQKLFFNGQELADDRDTEYYHILQNSHLHLSLLSQEEEEEEEEHSSDHLKQLEEPPQVTTVPVPVVAPAPQPPKLRPLLHAQSKGLKLMVLTKCGMRKIPVEVSAMDKVSELRKELQRLHEEINLQLPSEGNYFFIYKQNVMEDDRTFRWHGVKQGDTIEIFHGSITDGS